MEETYEQLEYLFRYGFSSSQRMNSKAKPKSAWVKHPQAPCEGKELKVETELKLKGETI